MFRSLFWCPIRRGASTAGGAPLSQRGQRLNPGVTRVVATEREGGEVDGPETLVDFFEGHVFAGQRTGQKQRLVAPRDLADRRDAADPPDTRSTGFV